VDNEKIDEVELWLLLSSILSETLITRDEEQECTITGATGIIASTVARGIRIKRVWVGKLT
jgi:hypothetical protein